MKYFCFTVDLEEMRLVADMGGEQKEEEDIYDVGEKGGEVLLDLLEEQGIKATFFTTGIMAKKKGRLIRRLVKEGHELACHGYTHEDVRKNVSSIEKAKNVLDKFSKTIGFRAPMGKVNEEVLKEVSRLFKYDSSILPIYIPGRYNNLKYPVKPFKLDGLWEIPISCTWFRIPIGWYWFRNFGYSWTKFFSRFCSSPVVFNIHPWDVVEIPERYNVRWDHRRNWDKTIAWLKKLIDFFKKDYKITTVRNYYKEALR